MRRTIIVLCFAASLLAAQVASGQEAAKTAPAIPERSGYLTDQAQLLKTDRAKQLVGVLQQVNQQIGAEIYILLVHSTKPLKIVPYTHQVAKAWGLNFDSQDKWLLILVAADDGGINIADSQATRAVLPDKELGLIIEKQLKPAFNAGNFAAGLAAGVKTIYQRLAFTPTVKEEPIPQTPKRAIHTELLLLGLIGLLAVVLYFLVVRSR